MDRGRSEADLHPIRVYLYRLRSILRHRWPDYLLLIVLIAVVGGVAMGSVVAGRRTQSAYGSFLRNDDASTLTVSTYGTYAGAPANLYSPTLEHRIRHLPGVVQVESWVGLASIPIEPDGTPVPAANNSVNVAASVDGVFFDEDRVSVIRGRMANPAAANEFMTSRLGAHLLGVHVGQMVPFGIFDQASFVAPGFGTAAVQPKVRILMRLAGIVEFNDQVIQDDTDRTPTNLVLTPAFTSLDLNQANGTWYAIRLKPSAKNLGELEQHLIRLLPPGSVTNFNPISTTEAKVESALRPESIALGVFGLIAALAALGICLPVMARLLVNSEDDRRVMRALGAPRSAVAADFYVGIVISVLLGTALACVISGALASLAPLGPVHAVYHPRAFTMDGTVTLVGVAVFGGILGAAAVVMAVRRASPNAAGDSGRRPAPLSRVAHAAASAGVPTSALVGIRFALEPGRGRTSVPARSVLAGAILSVTLVAATLTFASGLRTLVARPALYGWDWGYTLASTNNVPPDALAALQRDESIQAWTGYNDVNATIDGRSVPVLDAFNAITVAPPILAGRQIEHPGEIVLGEATLAALHKRIGDSVQLGYGSPNTAPLYLPPQPMKVVGTATFPAVSGSSSFAEHTSMGVGGLFSSDSLPRSFVSQARGPDPVQDGPPLVFVSFRPRTRRSVAIADLRHIVTIANRQLGSDPLSAGSIVSILPVQRPAAVVNYQSTGNTPLVLAIGLAVAATVALALSMAASVRRRRPDLAVLKTLGFVRRQMIGAVAAQALVMALLADAFGIPLGIAAGRQLWIAFARSIDAVPAPTVPASVALVAVGAVLIALLVAVLPGRLAARTPAATVLRAD